MKTILLSMLAVATLIGCQKDGDSNDAKPSEGKSYFSISIASKESGTRATETATTDEKTINSILIMGYDEGGNKVEVITTIQQLSGTAEVTQDLAYVFVVINPTETMLSLARTSLNFAEFSNVMNGNTAEFTGADKNDFVMVNSQSNTSPQANGLVEVVNVGGDTKIKTATVVVERLVSKFNLIDAVATQPDNTEISFKGFQMNATNKTVFPYSKVVKYTHPTNPNATLPYRIDPNYTLAEQALNKFEYVSSRNSIADASWSNVGEIGYALENTMNETNPMAYTMTQMLIKAEYCIKGVTASTATTPADHWFQIGVDLFTLAGIKEYYKGTEITDEIKNAMNDFIKLAGQSATWDAVTKEDLTAIVDGNYEASLIANGLIKFYQNSICYYDSPMYHNLSVLAASPLGRFGVVRNNLYHINVTQILRPGSPYIKQPDETTPVIPDTGNIVVTISIEDWTAWTQDTIL